MPTIFALMNVPFHLVTSAKTSKEHIVEWRDILERAAKSKSVRDAYAFDSCIPAIAQSDLELTRWFDAQSVQWRKLSTSIKLDK